MMTPRLQVLCRALLLCAAVPHSPGALVHADAGREVFEPTCQRCYAGPLNTPVEHIATVLRPGEVPQHRFSLTDEQIRNLIIYLQTLSS